MMNSIFIGDQSVCMDASCPSLLLSNPARARAAGREESAGFIGIHSPRRAPSYPFLSQA